MSKKVIKVGSRDSVLAMWQTNFVIEQLKKVTDEYVAENSDYNNIAELAEALINSEVKLADVGIKPVFRLHPPRKGYEDIRLSVNEGGSLGYRGEEIKDLAKRML